MERTVLDLATLRLRLDLAKVSGSRALELTALAADFENKMRDFIAYLEMHQIMTPDGFLERMKREIIQLQNKQQVVQGEDDRVREDEDHHRREQKKQIKNYVIDGRHAIFHRIEPGSFKMGEVDEQVDVTLTQPFEMMATLTTQIIWKKVAELANARFKKWYGFRSKYKINPAPSHFKGDPLPVENVSYDDIQIWLSALNELSQMGEPSLADLIPNHKQGDVYRLPTEAEWEFVVRGRGRYNDAYHFGDEESQLGDYAWFSGNSGNQTHPVAQKAPLVITGKEFYDLHGNVHEWVQDRFGKELPSGTDPQGPTSGSDHVIRGGSWLNDAPHVRSAQREDTPPEKGYSCVGFRLVRTVKSP